MPESTKPPLNSTLPVAKKPHLLSIGVVASIVVLSMVFGLVGAYGFTIWASTQPSSRLGVAQSKNVVVSEQNATIEVAKKVSPSVVSITTQASGRDVFGRTTQAEGAGTGIVLTKDGLVLTNKHVVEDGSSFSAVSSDGKTYTDVKLVATDPINDIAFIKINSGDTFTPAELGDSSKVEVGSYVVAIGNALGQFQNTVTTGVISGKSRPITAGDNSGSEQLQNLFQTDAAINPGNSGGPLVNVEGQVIGMNTAVAGQDSQNIGFAIPINDIKADITSVQEKGKIVRAYIGVRYIAITAEIAKANNLGVDYGAYIAGGQTGSGVVAGSPAEKAGLANSDIILKVNGKKIDANNSLTSLVNEFKVGDAVTLTVLRDGKEQQIKVTLAEAPNQL